MKISFNDIVAQLAHIGWGGWLPFLLARVLHSYHGFAWTLGLALAKESLETLGIAPWEPKQPWLGSAIDYTFFVLGALITYALFHNIF